MVTIAFHFRGITEGRLLVFAKQLVERCSTDHRFARVLPTVKVLATDLQKFEKALTSNSWSKSQTIDKNRKKEILKETIRSLGIQVQLLASGNKEIILAAGFEVRKKKTPLNGKLDKPVIKKLVNGIKSGDLAMAWKPVKGAINYLLDLSVDEKQSWTRIGFHSNSRVKLTDFKPGTHLHLRVQALGRKKRMSDPTEASIWVA